MNKKLSKSKKIQSKKPPTATVVDPPSSQVTKITMPPMEVYMRQMPANRIRNDELFFSYSPIIEPFFFNEREV